MEAMYECIVKLHISISTVKFTVFPRIECARCICFSALTLRVLFKGALYLRASCISFR